MNWPLFTLRSLLLLVLTFASASAQTPTKIQIPVAADTPGLKITGNKTAKVENIEGGGIRISYNHTGDKRSSIGIEYTFPQPVTATNMGFEFQQAETERMTASGTFGEKQVFTKSMDRMGPELFPYTLDFAYLASEKKMNIEGPLKKVSISFRIAPQAGERFVELKNWWVE